MTTIHIFGNDVLKKQFLWHKYQTAAEKIELLKMRIGKAQDAIQLQRREAKANVLRRAKAEWAISICTRQVMKCL